jgi:hypothetical protein
MGTAVQNVVHALRFLGEKLGRWDVTLVGSTAILLAWGLAALYGDDYVVSACGFFASIAWLTARSAADAEVRNHPHGKAVLAGLVILGAAVFGGSLILIRHVADKKLADARPASRPGPALALFDFNELSGGYLLNNTGEPVYVSSITTSVWHENSRLPPQLGEVAIDQMIYPNLQPSPFTVLSANPGVWHTIDYSSDDWNKAWNNVIDNYRFCSKAVVVSPDATSLKAFREHYSELE